MVAVKASEISQGFLKIADKLVHGETVLISRSKNQNLIVITESEYNELIGMRKSAIKNRVSPKSSPFDALANPKRKEGFMAGEVSVPVDFDTMLTKEIADMFCGSDGSI